MLVCGFVLIDAVVLSGRLLHGPGLEKSRCGRGVAGVVFL